MYGAVLGKLSNKDTAMLERAKKAASTSTCKTRHGAVVVSGGSVRSIGVNSYHQPDIKMLDFVPRSGWSIHAEEAALRAVGYSAPGAVIYVARVDKEGNDRLSKPCPRCQKLIDASGIKRVVYTV